MRPEHLVSNIEQQIALSMISFCILGVRPTITPVIVTTRTGELDAGAWKWIVKVDSQIIIHPACGLLRVPKREHALSGSVDVRFSRRDLDRYSAGAALSHGQVGVCRHNFRRFPTAISGDLSNPDGVREMVVDVDILSSSKVKEDCEDRKEARYAHCE